ASDYGLLNGPAAQNKHGAAEEELWLLGQPPLKGYLDFVEHQARDGSAAARTLAREEWQAANAYYQELERTEAGAANRAEREPLAPAMAALAAELKANARFTRSYD